MVTRVLSQPDSVFTASDIEILAKVLLTKLPILGVEGCGFNSGIIRQTFLQAAVDQKSIKTVTDTTHRTYSDNYILEQLHTVPTDDHESVVNDIFAQQTAIILGLSPRIICLNFVNLHHHGCPPTGTGELYHTNPRDGTVQCCPYLA